MSLALAGLSLTCAGAGATVPDGWILVSRRANQTMVRRDSDGISVPDPQNRVAITLEFLPVMSSIARPAFVDSIVSAPDADGTGQGLIALRIPKLVDADCRPVASIRRGSSSISSVHVDVLPGLYRLTVNGIFLGTVTASASSDGTDAPFSDNSLYDDQVAATALTDLERVLGPIATWRLQGTDCHVVIEDTPGAFRIRYSFPGGRIEDAEDLPKLSLHPRCQAGAIVGWDAIFSQGRPGGDYLRFRVEKAVVTGTFELASRNRTCSMNWVE